MAANTTGENRLADFKPVLAQGRLLLHTGDGKGKSTAAYGAALRAFGHRALHGKKVGIWQFIKDESFAYGERQVLRDIGIEVRCLGDGCSLRGQDAEGSRQHALAGWAEAEAALASGDYYLLVLDELTLPLHFGWLDEAAVLAALRQRAPDCNVIITGRHASQALIDWADTASNSQSIKHAYEQGITAQRGMEC